MQESRAEETRICNFKICRFNVRIVLNNLKAIKKQKKLSTLLLSVYRQDIYITGDPQRWH